MANRVTGRVEVLVNGSLLLNKNGAQAQGIGESGKPAVKREPVIGDTGIHGYKETIEPARLTVSITDRDDVSLSKLCAINGDGTVIMRAASGGKVYTMANAVCVGSVSVTAGEGETKIEFVGPYWTETTTG